MSGATRLNPWTNVYGLARSAIAFGTAWTLAANDADVLFRPIDAPVAGALIGLPRELNFFALWGDRLEPARWVAACLLALVASGWRPRVTGLVHWWISSSFAVACIPLMGGDHVASVLTLLMLPLTLTDPRRWHWGAPPAIGSLARLIGSRVAASALVACRVQVAVIYLWAGSAKFDVPEWLNGTALYYWVLDPKIALPEKYHGSMLPVLADPWGVSLLTWAPILLELMLFAALVMPYPYRRLLLPVALLFHLGNIVFFGLVSFFFSMAGALLLLLGSARSPLAVPQPVRQAVRAARLRAIEAWERARPARDGLPGSAEVAVRKLE